MHYSVFDAHCDTLCAVLDRGKSIAANDCHVDLKRMGAYEKYTQVFACFIAPEYRHCALSRCIDLIDAYKYSKANGILSIEGGECIEDVETLHMLYNEGVRIAALTWNDTNRLAAGADEKDRKNGLTAFGKKIVREMDKLKMTVDVSHLNDKAFYDVLEISKRPIAATHSNSRAVCPHRRNLTDDMFLKICERGGVAGINFYPPFLSASGRANIDDIVKHIEHFMSLGGENHIGIGADFDGVDCLPEGICGCEDTYKVFDRLLQLNYSEETVEKISHKNFERIFEGAVNCQDFLCRGRISEMKKLK